MGFLEDDLKAVLDDQVSLTGQGVVRWSGKKFTALFDHTDAVTSDGAGQELIQAGGMVLRCRSADLPSDAGQGQSVTIDGVAYVSRQLLKQDEGRVAVVLVSPA